MNASGSRPDMMHRFLLMLMAEDLSSDLKVKSFKEIVQSSLAIWVNFPGG